MQTIWLLAINLLLADWPICMFITLLPQTAAGLCLSCVFQMYAYVHPANLAQADQDLAPHTTLLDSSLMHWLCFQMHGDAPHARLNSVIHAIGLLSLVPDLAQVPDDGSASELATPPLPTSLVRP